MSAFAMAFVLPGTASGQSGDIVLWRDLEKGDAPETVATKLTTHPDIKSTRVKAGSKADVLIKYRSEGIEILSQTFHLALEFQDRGLTEVALGTDKVCAHDALDTYRDMIRALSEKYPTFIGPEGVPSESEHFAAYSDGTDESPQSVARLLTDGNVVVTYLQRFTAETPPPTGYSSNAAMNALGRLLWNQYAARARECDGTGAHRVQHMVTYLTKSDFEARLKDLREKDRGSIEAAKAKL